MMQTRERNRPALSSRPAVACGSWCLSRASRRSRRALKQSGFTCGVDALDRWAASMHMLWNLWLVCEDARADSLAAGSSVEILRL